MSQVRLNTSLNKLMSKSRLILLLTISTAFLCACSILPSSTPVNIYQLPEPSFNQPINSPVKSWSLRINRPDSNNQINSQRIIVLPDGNLVSSYQGARWSDTAPTILRNKIISGFITDGRIKSVSSDDRALYADFEIDSYLQSFQSQYLNGVPQVVIRLDAQLVNTNSRKILANRRFEIIQTTTGVNVPQIVTAFGEATDQLNKQLIDWTIKQVDQK